MRHVENRGLELVAHALDERDDLTLASFVERRQWLVHQQQMRVGEQRAPDGDALLFSAGQVVRTPVENLRDAEQVDNFIHPDLAEVWP